MKPIEEGCVALKVPCKPIDGLPCRPECNDVHQVYVTHWMPLPEPPE